MRVSSDMPRRERRSGTGRRVAIVVAIVLLVLFVLSLRGVARFYTDYLWFDSLDRADVWRGVLGAKIFLGVAFSLAFALLLWVNLAIADRLAPSVRPPGPEEDLLGHYHRVIGPRLRWVRILVAVLLGLVVGVPASAQWDTWILFRNGGSFGIDDPEFGRDIGFYVFELPFLDFVLGWLFGAFVFIFVLTAVAHYLNGGIRVQAAGERVTPMVKAHLSVLLAVLALLKGLDYWLQRFQLTLSSNGYVDGAGYTDLNARLPAANLLLLISLFSAGLLLYNIRRRGWALPAVAVGLWAFVAILMGGIYPAFVQWRTVRPAESEREAPYIARNIEATRAAYRLDEVRVEPFQYDEDLAAQDIRDNATMVRNARLLDPLITGEAFERLQRGRAFYRFVEQPGVDPLGVDRYVIDGELTSVVVGVRELDLDNVSGWENQHVGFTHGYGVAVAPAQGVTDSGAPAFIAGGIPVETTDFPEPLDQPQVYVGADQGGYAIVGANRDEVDYRTDDEQTVLTRYSGTGGVPIDSFIRRAAFALRFGQTEPLLSSFITSESRVLYIRDVEDRVSAVAPFMDWDQPYGVVHNGRIFYVLDGYTTSDDYPYSQTVPSVARRGTVLDGPFNYIRNPVKAVVDAYDGTVTLFRMPIDDPIADAYAEAFPDLFEPFDSMPDQLRDHIRYADDLFRVQTAMWGSYRVDDTQRFYSGDSAWEVAQDPGREGTGVGTDAVADDQTSTIQTITRRMEPYYGVFQLPEVDTPEYAVMRAFVPPNSAGQTASLTELTAFMVGRTDGGNYGDLVVYQMSAGREFDIPSPALADQRIRNEEDVARLQTELGQRGSEVLFGEMQLLPLDNTIVYIRPLFVRAEGENAVPELSKVIVALGGNVVMADDLQTGLETLVGGSLDDVFRRDFEDIDSGEPGAPAPDTTGPEETPAPDEEVEVVELLAEIRDLTDEADAAIREGGVAGLARYAELQDEIDALLEQAFRAAGGDVVDSTTTTTAPDGDDTTDDGPAVASEEA